MSGNVDENCLIVRNFPASYSERDIEDFLCMFDVIHVNIFAAQHTAIINFENKDHARDILTLLHQEKLDECRLFVEYAPKNQSHLAALCSGEINAAPDLNANAEKPREEINIGITEVLRRLYAIADNLNLNQPPPPHLRYEYPKVNRDIIDAICIALECVPKFYIQVLHLMNRMNLEPPFVPGDKQLVYESSSKTQSQRSTISTQTDEVVWQNSVRSKRKLVESDESELESSNSSDERLKSARDLPTSRSKRKKFIQKHQQNDANKQELLKQKQRNVLKMQRLQKRRESIEKPATLQINQQNVSDVFDPTQMKSTSIKIVVPEQLDSRRTVEENLPTVSRNMDQCKSIGTESEIDDGKSSVTHHIWSKSDLCENRIPVEQLKMHPLFQNYCPGEISNRLYIKNIAKEVTEVDLRAIYDRYLEMNSGGSGNIRSIDIRLMTGGRMKGQAFVTFDGPYLNCDVDDDNKSENRLSHKYQMIEIALRETNGLILKGKPLVVVYGKNK